MLAFNKGDIVAAYLKRRGFVGIGKITNKAKMIGDVRVRGRRLLDLDLVSPTPDHDCDDPEQCEYACTVKWIKRVPREDAKSVRGKDLFTTPLIRASLESQPKTLRFLEREFDVDFGKLLK